MAPLLPPMTLALIGVLAGLAPWLLDAPLAAAAAAILNRPQTLSLAIWHGFSPALMLSAVTLVGAWRSFASRRASRTRTLAARISAASSCTPAWCRP